MSRRRHGPEVVLRTVGWALERLLAQLTYCPECGTQGTGRHRDTCELARALKLYREWRDLADGPHPPLVRS